MPKTLIGAVVTPGKVFAYYRLETLGATEDRAHEGPWPDAVLDAAAALIAACDGETEDLDDVVQAQIYSAVTDPGGTAHADPGDIVDITFRQGAIPEQLRAGQGAAVPETVATARDALKMALQAAL
jgi:hypothetical protein